MGKSHGRIKSPNDIYALNIIDFGRLNGCWAHQGEAMETLFSWMNETVSWTIVDDDLRAYPERDDFPKWEHIGNHVELGRLYWNWFKFVHPNSILRFGDEPDFSGELNIDSHVNFFWGDIGQVSASTFSLTLKGMRRGDLWISVLGEQTQVILEAVGSIMDLRCYVMNKDGNGQNTFCRNASPMCVLGCQGANFTRDVPVDTHNIISAPKQLTLW